VAGTEPVPNRVVGQYRTGCGKLKKGKGFLKPNFELGPSGVHRIMTIHAELVCVIMSV
jgi:hypothetical protein